MEKRTYTLEKVEKEAYDFLKRKKQINNTTFINYRTSINYFIYYIKHIVKVEELGIKNKDKVLEGFQGSLFEGFKYIIDDPEAELPIERTVKIKASGVNTHIRRIKTFMNTSLGLTVELKKLGVGKPKYKALTVEQINLLVAECSNYWSNEEIAVRNSTLIQFLFNTAFRINEALTLLEENVIAEDGNYSVRIQEKGKAEGVLIEVAISENTYKMLKDYINIKTVPSDFVFSSIKASPDGKSKGFNRQNFNKAIIELASYTDSKHKTNISNIVKNNSSHVFRHSKATYLLNTVKEDVITVKEVLRHSSIDSTLIYLNPREETINKVRISNDI